MALLILGLVVFLGIHSIRIFADPWRARQIEKLGANAWKGIYALASLVGFVLIVKGFAAASASSMMVWSPPIWTWHITSALTLIALVLVVAAYVPNNAIKAKLKDPMILGVKTWALAHLLSNGTLAGIVLFGSFLVWAILDFRSCRLRRGAGVQAAPTASGPMTILALALGIGVWIAFALYLHQALIGIKPMA